ncbi:hypothetical protein HBJ59_13195 [Pseudomonas sp. AN3A02]|jgi:hypothetical protein|nr:hypothetical protein [Pseudomonas sp. AN3A02]
MVACVPYFCQWESRLLAADIISGEKTVSEDPLWINSGARCVDEYALWANHVCGMACLKMLLAAKTGLVHSTFSLLEKALAYGAYVVDGESIHGMIYAPAIEMLNKEFGLKAQIVTGISAEEIKPMFTDGHFFIASVHPSIRWPEQEPPKKGGHLVLVTDATDDFLKFHNPSGHNSHSQENVVMNVESFGRYFAGRGILIR